MSTQKPDISTQKPNHPSLSELVEQYATMSKVVQSLSNEDICSRLSTVYEKGMHHIKELSENNNELKREIDQYLRENKPFEWNRSQSTSKEERAEKDWEQHDNLTLFAMLLGNTELLKYWGVDYPLNPDGPGLADASIKYIEALENARSQCEVDVQREYYDYLIDQLKAHPQMK